MTWGDEPLLHADAEGRRQRVLGEPDLPSVSALPVTVATCDVDCLPAVGTEIAAEPFGHLDRFAAYAPLLDERHGHREVGCAARRETPQVADCVLPGRGMGEDYIPPPDER